MKKTAVFTLTLLVLSTIGLQTTFAQDSPQLNLPEGATARLGKGQITEVTYSPDGTRLAVASSIGIWIYDAQTGEELNPIIGHTGFVNSVSFSPDGQTLVSGSRGGTVRLWDAETCTNLNTLNGHTASVNSVSFSPDGQTLVSGSSDRTVRLWDAETRTNLNTLNGHTASVNSVSFSPDGQTLVSGSRDETVRLWDADTGINLHTLTGHTDSVNSVSFSPDGQVLVSGSSDGTIWLWDVDTRKHIRTIKATHVPGFADVNSVAFSPDGSMLVSAADDTTIRLWDVDTGQHIRSIRFLDTDFVDLVSLWDVSFSPDGNTIVCSSEFNAVTLWDVNTGEHIGTLNTIRGHTDAVNSIAFSPDGNTLVSGGRDKTLRLWNVDTGQHIRLITGRQHRLADSLLTYHLVYVVSVAFSPDGNTIASGSDRIRLWDADTGRYKDTLERYIQYLYSIAFSPDRNTIASASQVGGLSLWDADTGQRIHRLTRRLGALSVSFSPDGQTLASGSWGGDIRLWDVETGQHLDTLTGHTGAVRSVSFSPDGQVLASSSDDATIRLWDAETGTNLHTLTGHTDSVNSVAFSSDGNTIASGSSDATIRLWDVETGQHLDTLTGHTDSVKSVAFSPDSSTLASGSWDWTVLLWDVSEWMGPRPTPTDVRGPSVTKMSNVTDGEEADLEVLNRDGIIIEFDEDIAYSSLKLTLEDGTDLGWESTVKDNSVILTPFAGKELVHETSYVVSGTVRDGVGNETDLTLTFVTVKSPVTTDNEPTPTTDSRQAFESSAPSGYTRVTLSDKGPMWGVPTKYTSDSDAGTVAYMVLGRLKGCSFADAEADRQSKVYIKTQVLGLLDNFASETVCGKTSSLWATSWDGVRITHLRFFDESSPINIKEAVYNALTGQIELVDVETTEPKVLEADINGDGVVNILDLVLVASNLGQTGQNAGDVNGDGVVNILDLVKVAGALGNTAAAPSLYPQVLEMLTAADVRQWLTQAQHLKLTDATSQRGIRFLEQLLAALTPKETALLPNYPNPFNPETWIPYRLAEDALVRLTIYNGSGRVVCTLNVGHRVAAFYESRSKAIYWDGRNEFGEGVASGVYFYHLSAGDYSATRKMLILK